MNPKEYDLEEIEKILRKNTAELKQFNKDFVENLEEDMYIDVMDKVKIWRSGRIVRRKDNIAEVGFEGWTRKWNENKKINTGLITPFRSKISGYSGPKKRKIVNHELIEDLVIGMMEVESNVFKNNMFFDNFTPEDMVYVVRGKMFYMYNMIFMVEKSLNPNALATINSCLNNFILFFLEYLDRVQEHIPIYSIGRTKEKLFYMVNKEISLVSAAPEIFELFETFMGLSTRSRRIYMVNNFPEKKDFDVLYAGKNKLSLPKSNQLLNMFLNAGGYDKFISLINGKWELKNKEESIVLHLPAKIVFLILTTIRVVLTKLDKSHMKSFTDKIISAMNNYFKTLNDHDVQYNLLENYLKCLKYYYTFHSNFPIETSAVIIDVEEAAILINLKYLSCKIFERKYQGIQLLVSRLDSIKDEKDKEVKREFLLKNKVLEIVYIKGYHKAVAEKSTKLLEFLVPSLNAETLIFLLESGFSQSDEKASVICTTIKKVIQHLNLDIVNEILEKLKNVEPNKIRPETIELVLEIIIQSGKTNSVFNFYKNRVEAKKAFDQALKFLWRCLENAGNISSSTVNTVLFALMDQVSNLSEKLKLIDLCLKDVLSRTIKTQHVILMNHIMDGLSNKRNYVIGSDFDKLLDRIYSQVKNFTLKMVREFKDRTESQINEDHFIEDQIYNTRIKMLLKLIFKGRPRNDSKSSFEQLITFLTSDEKQRDHLMRLLDIIQNDPIVTKENSEIFFGIFETENKLFNGEEMSVPIYEAFQKLFIGVNFEVGAIENFESKKYYTIVKQDKLIHLDTLWNICLNKSLPKTVKDKYFLLLITCYFLGERNFEAPAALVAWNYFISDTKAKKEMGEINTPLQLGNLAYAWITALNECLGRKTIESTSFSDTKVHVLLENENLGYRVNYLLPFNASLNFVRLKAIEDLLLHEADITLTLFDNKLRYDHLELYTVAHALQHRKESLANNKLVLGFVVNKQATETPHTLKKGVRIKMANDSLLTPLFFDNMDLEEEGHIWKLLISIPKNKKRTRDLLKTNDSFELKKFLKMTSPRFTLYNLTTIYDALDRESKEYNIPVYSKFRSTFIQKKLYFLLVDMIIDIKFDSIENKNKINTVVNGVFKIMDILLSPDTQFVAREEIVNQEEFFEYVVNCFRVLEYILTKFTGQNNQEFHKQNIPIAIEHLSHILELNTRPEKIQGLINWGDLYTKIFVENENEELKSIFAASLKPFLHALIPDEFSFREFIFPLYERCLVEALKNPKKSTQILYVIYNLSKNYENDTIKKINGQFLSLEQRWEEMFQILKNCDSNDEELVSVCLKILSISAVTEGEGIEAWVAENKDELKELLQICSVNSSGIQIKEPLCLSSDTIEAFYNFLCSFSKSSTATQTFFEYFEELVKLGNWRTGLYKNWSIEVAKEESKKLTKYAGLKNLGCICYMNSVFQQLFMIPDFRDYIISSDIKMPEDEDFQSNTLFQFQVLMKSLRDVPRKFHSPTQFCMHFKNFDGTPIDVFSQMDADEFLNNLLDKLENELKKAEQNDVIKRTFGGEIVQEIICKDHDYKSERATPFLALPLDVRGNINLKQCLDKYVAGEMLEGENQYYCEDLSKKVDALKRECIKRLPNVLIIVLKRFSFNYENMQKVKINDFCEFPDKLDMSKYTQEFLNNGETDQSKDYYNFNLRGVVIHKGSADSGHYYSLIKDQNKKWFEFNDTIVKEFHYKDMPNEAYGDNKTELSQSRLTSNKLKGTNAYMLFYERSSLYDEEKQDIGGLLEGFNSLLSPTDKNIISDEILHENFQHYNKKFLFDNCFADFVCDTLENMNTESLIENEVILRVGFTCFMNVLMRKSQKDKIPRSYKVLVNTLSSSVKVARWFLENICSHEFIEEFLIDCIIMHMKYFVVGLIKVAIKTLNEKPDYGEDEEQDKQDEKLLKDLTMIYAYNSFKGNMSFTMHLEDLIADLSDTEVGLTALNSMEFGGRFLTRWQAFDHLKDRVSSIEEEIEGLVRESKVFKGYLGKEPKSEVMSIEDLQARKKGEELSKKYFVNNLWYSLYASLNLVRGERLGKLEPNELSSKEIFEHLVKSGIYFSVALRTSSRKCLTKFAEEFVAMSLLEEVDKEELETRFGLVKDSIARNNSQFCFFKILKLFADSDLKSESQMADNSLIVLNIFAELLHAKNIDTRFDRYLNYFFFILKGNKIIFDKVNNRGAIFLDQIRASIFKFTRKRVDSVNNDYVDSVLNLTRTEMLNCLNTNKEIMLERLEMVREGRFEDLCNDIKMDYDYIFDPEGLEEVDLKMDGDAWKTYKVEENLGVMLKIANVYPSSEKIRSRWMEYDDRRFALPHTASVEHRYNPWMKH